MTNPQADLEKKITDKTLQKTDYKIKEEDTQPISGIRMTSQSLHNLKSYAKQLCENLEKYIIL